MQKVKLSTLLLIALVGTQECYAELLPLHVKITVQRANHQKERLPTKDLEVRSHVNLPRDGSLEDAKKEIATQIDAKSEKLVLSTKGHPIDHTRWVSWIRKARQPGADPTLDVAVRK